MDRQALTELAHAHPHEACIVFRRMIYTGAFPSLLFIFHNAYILHAYGSLEQNPILFAMCAIRIVLGFPRPYLWYVALGLFKNARHKPTPQRVTRAFLDIFDHPLIIANERLGWIFMTWLSSMVLCLNLKSWVSYLGETNEFERRMLSHVMLNMCIQVILRVVIVMMLYYLIHSDIERGVSKDMLDDCSER
jgi:hypothetical protein